jgi:multiple sugar transport system substrate-binding protein
MGALSLSLTRQFDSQKLLDHEAAAKVVKNLGADTFAKAALELNQDDGQQVSVPDSAYAQILVYRKDLFEKAGLQPPTSYETLEKAAAALTTDGTYGITLATDPADVFTSQTFESLALANDCQLVNKSGDITLESEECAATWDLYGSLAENSPSGTQTVDTTRASYFAGQAAMVDWSTYILDELAGLRNDALPTCPECVADPEWLAKNSGIVTSISGADGETGGTYGEATSWSITKNASASASTFIEYMLSDGYMEWLAMAPEGKFPLRQGDATDAQKYSNAWLELQAGVDTKKKLSEVYDAETMTALQAVPESINRWAIPQGHGSLLGPVNTQLPIAKAIADFASGAVSPDEAAATATEVVKQLQSDLK